MPRRKANFPFSYKAYKLGQDGLRFEEGFPDIEDISRHLRFDAATGNVWQNDQKVLVLPMNMFESFRLKLLESLNHDDVRRTYSTLGFELGRVDAVRAKKLRGENLHDAIAAGPQLVALKGLGYVDPLTFKVDFAEGIVNVDAVLIGNVEADIHIQNFGVCDHPSCWFMVGHASGFFTWYMGKPVLFSEIECRAMGSSRCRVIGKALEEYKDAKDEAKFFNVPEFMNYKAPQKKTDHKPRKWLEEEHQPTIDSETGKPVAGASPGFKVAMQMLKKVATTNATVLFNGRTGVGKEFFAQTLHSLSKRSDKPLIAVNCAAVPDDLLESELFGVERGAFTGASEARAGRFERANGGTLFLDEVSSLTLPAQGKLLRALQEGQIERLGGTETINVDVRIIAATNVDLRDEVEAKRFREDLFFRLNIFPIYIPPLRSRRQDIPLLMNLFLDKYAKKHDRKPTGFSEEAVEALLSYDWPGNIRELENMIERAVILAGDDNLIHTNHLFASGEHLPENIFTVDGKGQLSASSPFDINWDDLAVRVLDMEDGNPIMDFENALIRNAVERAGGNVSSAAAQLGMTRGQLDYRLKKKQE